MGSGDENQKSTFAPKGYFPFMSISAKQMEERDLLLDALAIFQQKKLGAILYLKERTLPRSKNIFQNIACYSKFRKIIIKQKHCSANKHINNL
jgi:hypothetical protein